jgi:hypothetical protein
MLIVVGLVCAGMGFAFVLGYYHGYVIATTKEDS